MAIDVVVSSLSEDWSHYTDPSLDLLASIDLHVPFGAQRLPYDRALAARAFLTLPFRRKRPSVALAVRRFQEALSVRFDCTISWRDPEGVEVEMGQIDPDAAVAVSDLIRRVGTEGFPNLAVLDIENMYLPVELPAVLVGQPRTIGSALALAREVSVLRALVGDDEDIEYFLSIIEEACEMAAQTGAVILVCG